MIKIFNLPHLTFNIKIRSLQALNHLILILGLIYAGSNDNLHLLWISFIVYIFTAIFGIACGMHRLLAHKSYKVNKFWEYFLSICSIYATVGSTIAWVALHRLHHVTAEKPNDPHSPYVGRGANETRQFNYWQAFKSWVGIWSVDHIPPRYVIDLIHDPFHSFIHRYYFQIIMLTCLTLIIINPWLVLFVYVVPACLSLHATSVISVIAHVHGYRSHVTNDESRNSWISSIVTFGDGWHNNHHANPSNWTTKERWWELDPCGWFIFCIKKD
jgi:fatty-acid desaturase